MTCFSLLESADSFLILYNNNEKRVKVNLSEIPIIRMSKDIL